MKKISYAYKSAYSNSSLNLSIDLEIYNKAKTIFIHQIKNGIKEYNVLFNYLDYSKLTELNFLYPIDHQQPIKCIFCHKTSEETKFGKDPHVIPYLLGNPFLLHYEECNECNSYFGETLECELDKYLKPYRTLNRLKNRSGNLIRTDFSPKRSFRYEEAQNTYFFDLLENELSFDHDKNTATIHVKREKHSPLLVYKALMKIFFGLLPREHLSKFENLRQWIIDRDKNSKIFSPLTVIKTRLNGYSTATLDVIILHKPVTTIEEFQKSPARENYEYLGYIRFGSITFEIPLLTDLSFEKLNIMKQSNIKTEFSFPHIPKPGYPIDYEILDFSETKKIRDVETMYFGYTKMTETKLD